MSRIGKHPVIVPAGVTVEIDGHTVKVTGPKGTLERTFTPSTTITLEDGQVKVDLIDGVADSNAQQGLTRTLINNMVVGVSEGFAKKLCPSATATPSCTRPPRTSRSRFPTTPTSS